MMFVTAGDRYIDKRLENRELEFCIKAIRTVVILFIAWGLVYAEGAFGGLFELNQKTLLFLSGMATGLSWLCYFRALQLGPASLNLRVNLPFKK